MRKSSKHEYEKAMPYGMDYDNTTAFVKKTTHRAVRRKLNNQTKIVEQIVDSMLHCSNTDTNYQKGL
jgi:hypothetical protein